MPNTNNIPILILIFISTYFTCTPITFNTLSLLKIKIIIEQTIWNVATRYTLKLIIQIKHQIIIALKCTTILHVGSGFLNKLVYNYKLIVIKYLTVDNQNNYKYLIQPELPAIIATTSLCMYLNRPYISTINY